MLDKIKEKFPDVNIVRTIPGTSSRLPNSKKPRVVFVCKCGVESSLEYRSGRNHVFACEDCKPSAMRSVKEKISLVFTYKDVCDLVSLNGVKLAALPANLNEKVALNQHFDFICHCGTSFRANPYNIRAGVAQEIQCSACILSKKSRIGEDQYDPEFWFTKLSEAHQNQDFLEVQRHGRGSVVVTAICTCGDVFTREYRPYRYAKLETFPCQSCHKKQNYQKQLETQGLDPEIAKSYFTKSGATMLTEYSGLANPIRFQCRCGKEGTVTLNPVHYGRQQEIICKDCVNIKLVEGGRDMDRQNKIKRLSGADHPSWNPNLTDEDRAATKHGRPPEFERWWRAVYRRDKYTCQISGQVGGALSAHHIKWFGRHPDGRYDVENGITISRELHKEFHSLYTKDTVDEVAAWQTFFNTKKAQYAAKAVT